MAIQNRRGQYADFDPSKAVPGELLTVLSGDPNAKDGKAVYMTFASGDVKRMATYEDMVDNIEAATEEVAQDVADQIEENLQSMVTTAQTAAQTATTKANEASQSASSVSASATQIATNTSDISDLKSAMDDAESSIESLEATKADTDGFYEDMTVGTAEAVLSETFTADSVPYHFRKTPFGDRLKEKIIGGTVAWNQLIPFTEGMTWSWNGIQFSFNNGKISASGTAEVSATGAIFPSRVYSKIKPIKDHVYYVHFNGDFTFPSMNFTIYGSTTQAVDMARKRPRILKCTVDNATDAEPIASAVAGTSYTADFSIYLCDLTKMFDSTIADYIYNLEQTTAGAGVALFRELFPKDYYEYDAGSLQSVSGLQSHDEVGFNQWDEEWELGSFSWTSGEPANLTDRIRSKNFCNCFPNTNYYVKGSITILFYDANYEFLGDNNDGRKYVSNAVMTTSSNARYFKICDTIRVTYNHDICINISDPSKNGTYEPYKKHSYALDSSLTLRGVPKLVDNKIQFDGDVYESDGKVTRRYGVVDLGTLDWEKQLLSDNVHYNFRTAINNFKLIADSEIANIICSKYTPVSTLTISQVATITDKTISSRSNTIAGIRVYDSSYTDAAAFKAAMSGVYLVYELATPTTEEAQPYTNPQRCAEGGTEEYVTTGIVPVGHESEYYENIVAKVDGLPYDLSMIAPIENGTTASKAYSVGQYFLHNDQFCKAKTAIASGATFTLNTNYEVTTVANELYTALH